MKGLWSLPFILLLCIYLFGVDRWYLDRDRYTIENYQAAIRDYQAAIENYKGTLNRLTEAYTQCSERKP